MIPLMTVRLFLCGDVMTGRGIDQVLPVPSEPALYEPYVRSARDYVALAEGVSGPIPAPVTFDYLWGDAMSELAARSPDARIINLETSVTTSASPEPKGIHYRMHPANVPCLTAAGIDCCALANNHVLDWGRDGLFETLKTLRTARISPAGAGEDATAAAAPAVVTAAGHRILVFAFGTPSSGIPAAWAATAHEPGVWLLARLDDAAAGSVIAAIERHRRDGDRVIVSVHWGGNWGYAIPDEQQRFARRLIESGLVDIVHGHSAHHPKGIEVYRGRLVLYGCGDFIDDYEGIAGHEAFRPNLRLAYFPTISAATGELCSLEMVPFVSHRFRLVRASDDDVRWLQSVLSREGRPLGTSVERTAPGVLSLRW